MKAKKMNFFSPYLTEAYSNWWTSIPMSDDVSKWLSNNGISKK